MIEWMDEGVVEGVKQSGFLLADGKRRVPGLAWTPQGRARSLVLLGHGASGSKRTDYIQAVARRLVRQHGFAAVAIDGPVHGDRRTDTGASEARVFEDFRRAAKHDTDLTDTMVADWTAVLDGLEETEVFGRVPVAYWGLSMGTMLGLPFVAQEPRIRAAVLGLMGVGVETGERLAKDASLLGCPVLFMVQWNDELIPRDTALTLFDKIASKKKTLLAHPGSHVAVPRSAFTTSEAFLAKRLNQAE